MDVYAAEGPGGPVALKLPRDPADAGDLFIEGALLDALNGTGVVRVVGHCAEGTWLALELLPGPTLVAWARGRPVPAVVDALATVATTAADLHRAGVVHGDLKPGNVLMDGGGHPRVLDLGLSATGWDTGFYGTFGAAAPEQLRGEPPTEATDVFALGVLAFRALTGGRPFSVHREAQALLPTARVPWSPAMVRPGLPDALDDLVARMLARDPIRRPPMAGLDAALRAAAGDAPLRLHPCAFLHWRVLGAVLADAADGGAPPVVVAFGPDDAPRAGLRAAVERAAVREGLVLADAPAPRTVCWTADAALAEAHLRTGSAGLVVVTADRPQPALDRLGAVHIDLRVHEGRPAEAGDTPLVRALAAGPLEVEAVAALLDRTPHEVLDLAEPLLESGVLEEVDGGRGLALAAVQPTPPRP